MGGTTPRAAATITMALCTGVRHPSTHPLTHEPKDHPAEHKTKGPSTETNAYWRTTGAKKIRRGDLSQGFHTYGIQWTEDYIYFYIDSRVHQILFIGFHDNRPMYERGHFRELSENQTLLENPWAESTSTSGNAPFDQKFYLIMNVAVGSRSGWFL